MLCSYRLDGRGSVRVTTPLSRTCRLTLTLMGRLVRHGLKAAGMRRHERF